MCSAWHTSHHSAIHVRCALGKSSRVQCMAHITSFNHSCAVCSRQVQLCAVQGTHHIIQPFMCGVLQAYIIQPVMCGVLHASPVVCSAWHTSHHSAIHVRCAPGKSSRVQCMAHITSFSHSCAVCSRRTSFSHSCAVCSRQVQSCAVQGIHCSTIIVYMCSTLKVYIVRTSAFHPYAVFSRHASLNHSCVVFLGYALLDF